MSRSRFSSRHRSNAARAVRYAIEECEQRTLLANITATTPWNGQQSVSTTANLTVTFGEAMNTTTLTTDRIVLRDSNGAVVTSALTYNATSRVLTINPTPTLVASSSYYTLRVVGGAAGVKASDGSTLGSDYVMGFACGTANLTQQTVFSGLSKPINIEFSPDGRIYIAEQSGIIKLFDNLSDTTPTIAADFRTSVHNFWDRGLLGMALDPQFTTGRPYVYVLYTYDGLIGEAAPRWGTIGGSDDPGGTNSAVNGVVASGRLSRFAVGANGLISGSEQVLIHDWVQQFPSHSIGDLKFGPDGYLYASSGDGASFNIPDYGQVGNPFNDPLNEGGAVRSQDIRSDGDAAGLDGTIIRVDPNTGAAAPGNPFASSSDANKQRVIANGLRNPFRITFKPGTRELYVAETGWTTWEEINRVADATDAVAENFGWPAYEGPNRQSGYDALNLPLLESLYATPSAHTAPWFAYQHSQQVVPGSGEPTGGSSPTGIAFYTGASYPLAYDGALFFADYSRQRIYVMYKGPDGQVNPNARQLVTTAGVVELTVGPGGDIYAVGLASGTITRFVATSANRPPVVTLTADKTTGNTPLIVNFDARQSVDPDGGALSYAWDLDADGAFDDGNGSTATWTYTQPVDVTVRVRVTDVGGASSDGSIVIRVANRAPVPTITSPLTTLRWSVGDTISFAGSAIDPEDGALAAARLSWDLILIHGNEINPSNTHEHRITGFTGVASGSFVAPEHDYPSWLELRLTATDSRGLAATTSLRVDPRTALLSFRTTPAGLKLIVDGAEYAAPFERRVIANSTHTISAAATQVLGTTGYTFASWSQGGAANQSLVAPNADATYTATYTTTPPGGTVPAVPTGLSATVLAGPQVRLDWTDASNNETAFVVQRRYAGWIWEDLAITAAANAVSATDTTSIGGVVYEYRIAARNAAGTSAWSNIVSVNTSNVGVQPPTAPTALTASPFSGTRVDLAWTDNSGNETGFRIERRAPGGTFTTVVTTAANVRTYSDTSATSGSTYEYRVLAVNGALASAASNVVTVLTPGGVGGVPATPTNFTAVVQANRSVLMNWTDNSATETGFIIQRRYRGWIWEDLATVGSNVTSFTDSTTIANVAYEYRVVAIGPGGTSTPSNGVEVVIP